MNIALFARQVRKQQSWQWNNLETLLRGETVKQHDEQRSALRGSPPLLSQQSLLSPSHQPPRMDVFESFRDSSFEPYIPWTPRSYLYSTHPESPSSPMESIDSSRTPPPPQPPSTPIKKIPTTPKKSQSPRKVVSPSNKQSPKRAITSSIDGTVKASPSKPRGNPFTKGM